MKKLVVVSWLLLAVCVLGAGIWDGLGEDPLGPNGAPVAGNGGGSEFLPFPGKGQPTPRPRGPGAVDFFVSTNNQTYEGFPGARSFGLQGSGTVHLRLLTEDLYDPRVEIIGDEYNETNTVTIRQGDYDSGPQPVNASPIFELPVPESGNTITITQEGTEYTDTQFVSNNPTFTLPAPPKEFEETNTITLTVPNNSSSTQAVSNSPSFTLPDPTITVKAGESTETKKVWGSPIFLLPSPTVTITSRVGSSEQGVWGSPSFTLPDPTITLSSGGSSTTKHVLDNPEFRYISPPNPDDYADWLWATNMDGNTANIYAYIGNREDVTVPEYLDGYKVVSLDARYSGPESVAVVNRAGGAAADFMFSSDATYYPWARAWIESWNASHPDDQYSVTVGGTRRTRAQVRDLVASGDCTDCEGDESLDALVDDFVDSLVDVGTGGSGGAPRGSPLSVFPQYYGNSLSVDNGFEEGFGYNRAATGVFSSNCQNAVVAGYRADNYHPVSLRWDGHQWPFGGYGFTHSDIEDVYMPHVYWVGQYAFADCMRLARARFPELQGKVGTLAFSSTHDLSVLDFGFVSVLPGRVVASKGNNPSNVQVWIDGPRPEWTLNDGTTTGFDKAPDGLVTHYRRGMPGWEEYWSDAEKLVNGPGMFGMRPAIAEATTYEEPGGWDTPDGASGDWYVSSNKLGAVGNVRLTGSEGSLRLEAPAFDPYGCARRLRVWDMGSSAVSVKGAANEVLAIVGPGEVREFVWGGDASPAAKKWRVLGQTFTDPIGFGDNVFGSTESNPETDLRTMQYIAVVGAGALSGGGGHTGVAAVGHYAGKDSTNLQWTTLLGNEAGARSKGLFRAAAIGPMTFDGAEGVSNSAAIGVWAGANASFVSNQVFIDAHDIGVANRGGGGTRDAEPAYDPTAAAIWVDDGDVYLGRNTNDVFFNTTYKGRHATNNVNHLRGNWVVDGTLSSVQDEEYWCRWGSTSLSDSTTNWIPLYDDWPARNITCFLNVGQMTNCVIAIPRNLKPEKDCHLRFVVSKTSTGNAGVGSLVSADGTEICSMGTGYNYRVWLLEWKAAFTNWCILNYTLNTRPYSVQGATQINYGQNFPADRFLAVTGNEPGVGGE